MVENQVSQIKTVVWHRTQSCNCVPGEYAEQEIDMPECFCLNDIISHLAQLGCVIVVSHSNGLRIYWQFFIRW
jgi:hypothetical protein